MRFDDNVDAGNNAQLTITREWTAQDELDYIDKVSRAAMEAKESQSDSVIRDSRTTESVAAQTTAPVIQDYQTTDLTAENSATVDAAPTIQDSLIVPPVAPTIKDSFQVPPATEGLLQNMQQPLSPPTPAQKAQYLIGLSKTTNPVSLLHEITHVVVNEILDARHTETGAALAGELLNAFDYQDVPQGTTLTEFQEKVASAFEQYLATGETSAPELKTLFAKFKEYLAELWRAISSLNLDPRVRETFENWLATPSMDTAAEIAAANTDAQAEINAAINAVETVDAAEQTAAEIDFEPAIDAAIQDEIDRALAEIIPLEQENDNDRAATGSPGINHLEEHAEKNNETRGSETSANANGDAAIAAPAAIEQQELGIPLVEATPITADESADLELLEAASENLAGLQKSTLPFSENPIADNPHAAETEPMGDPPTRSPIGAVPFDRSIAASPTITPQAARADTFNAEILRRGELPLSNGTKIPFEFQAVELDDLIASHTLGAKMSIPDSRYPAKVQERQRDRDENLIAQIAQPLNTAEVLNNSPIADSGAPVVVAAIDANGLPLINPETGRPQYFVIGGNGRTLMIAKNYRGGREYGHGEPEMTYKPEAVSRAPIFGLNSADVAMMASPVVVRTVNALPHEFALLSAQLNETRTASKNTSSRAVTLGRKLRRSGNFLKLLSEIADDETLTQFIDARSDAIIAALKADNVLTTETASELTNSRGLSEIGKAMLKDGVAGIIVDDVNTLDSLSDSARDRLFKIAPTIAATANYGDYSLATLANDAAKIAGIVEEFGRSNKIEARGKKLWEQFYAYRQGDVFQGTEAAREIIDRDSPAFRFGLWLFTNPRVRNVRQSIGQYLTRANIATDPQASLFGDVEQLTSAQAFAEMLTGKVEQKLYQPAYHGTPNPNVFDRFDNKYLRTGTGDMIFGYGWYAAQDKEVSDGYAKMRDDNGHLYRVEVPENDVLLDFDAPLTSQPEKVQAAVRQLGIDNEKLRGWEIYRDLGRKLTQTNGISLDKKVHQNVNQAASEALLKLGVKGIRYLDGKSRDAGDVDGTRNFVIFHDNDITIEQKLYQASNRGLTLSALQRPEFIKQRGKKIGVAAFRQMLEKAQIKAADKAVMLETLDDITEKSVLYDDFEKAVKISLVPFERLHSDKYADYGYQQIFGEEDADKKYSVVLNMPEVDHGETGHWNDVYEGGDPRGMFGHFRFWLKDNAAYIAELQSDYFQKAREDLRKKEWNEQAQEIRDAAEEKVKELNDTIKEETEAALAEDPSFDALAGAFVEARKKASAVSDEYNDKYRAILEETKDKIVALTKETKRLNDNLENSLSPENIAAEIERLDAEKARKKAEFENEIKDIKAKYKAIRDADPVKYAPRTNDRWFLDRAFEDEIKPVKKKFDLTLSLDLADRDTHTRKFIEAKIAENNQALKDGTDEIAREKAAALKKLEDEYDPITAAANAALDKAIAGKNAYEKKRYEEIEATHADDFAEIERREKAEIDAIELPPFTHNEQLFNGFEGIFENRLIQEAVNEAIDQGAGTVHFPTRETLIEIEKWQTEAVENGDYDAIIRRYEGLPERLRKLYGKENVKTSDGWVEVKLTDKIKSAPTIFYQSRVNGGWNDDLQMSNRAVQARNNGLITAADLGVSEDALNKIRVRYEEWHHTGENFKETNFYDPQTIYDTIFEAEDDSLRIGRTTVGKLKKKLVEKYGVTEQEPESPADKKEREDAEKEYRYQRNAEVARINADEKFIAARDDYNNAVKTLNSSPRGKTLNEIPPERAAAEKDVAAKKQSLIAVYNSLDPKLSNLSMPNDFIEATLYQAKRDNLNDTARKIAAQLESERAAAIAKLQQNPVYRAVVLLTNHGGITETAAQEFGVSIPVLKKHGLITDTGGASLPVIAAMAGYENIGALMLDLQTAPTLNAELARWSRDRAAELAGEYDAASGYAPTDALTALYNRNVGEDGEKLSRPQIAGEVKAAFVRAKMKDAIDTKKHSAKLTSAVKEIKAAASHRTQTVAAAKTAERFARDKSKINNLYIDHLTEKTAAAVKRTREMITADEQRFNAKIEVSDQERVNLAARTNGRTRRILETTHYLNEATKTKQAEIAAAETAAAQAAEVASRAQTDLLSAIRRAVMAAETMRQSRDARSGLKDFAREFSRRNLEKKIKINSPYNRDAGSFSGIVEAKVLVLGINFNSFAVLDIRGKVCHNNLASRVAA